MQTNDPTQSDQPVVPPADQPGPPESAARPAGDETAAQAGEPAVPAQQPAAVPPKESGFKRGARYTLGTETRFGRFMRTMLRFLATVLGLFALGLLAGYLLLARPLDQQARSLRADVENANASLAAAEAGLESARQDAARLEREASGLRDDLRTAQARILLLRASADVAAARMELALNRPAAAKQALETTPAALTELQASLPGPGAEQVKAIAARLELSVGEIDTDPRLASSDLEILIRQLDELEASLFPE